MGAASSSARFRAMDTSSQEVAAMNKQYGIYAVSADGNENGRLLSKTYPTKERAQYVIEVRQKSQFSGPWIYEVRELSHHLAWS